MDKNKGKVMFEVLFHAQIVVQYDFIPEGHTVNKYMHVEPSATPGLQ
jgi:hypothetical protein